MLCQVLEDIMAAVPVVRAAPAEEVPAAPAVSAAVPVEDITDMDPDPRCTEAGAWGTDRPAGQAAAAVCCR